MTAAAPKPRRTRSATESLLSIVLVLEALLAFFLTLVVFSLGVLEPTAAFIGGGALFLVVLLLSRVMRFGWAVVTAFAMQALLVATGVLVPLMYLIGTGFAALFTYCFVTGRRLDRRNVALAADGAPATADRTTDDRRAMTADPTTGTDDNIEEQQ